MLERVHGERAPAGKGGKEEGMERGNAKTASKTLCLSPSFLLPVLSHTLPPPHAPLKPGAGIAEPTPGPGPRSSTGGLPFFFRARRLSVSTKSENAIAP